MTIVRWKEGQMVRVTPEEALIIITSLSEQIRTNSANGPRHEFNNVSVQNPHATKAKNEYFSIAVHEKGDRV